MKTKEEYTTPYVIAGCDYGEVTVPKRNEGEPVTYAMLAKGSFLRYVEADTLFGLNISSVHKPSISSGAGFGIHRRLTNPTLKHLKEGYKYYPEHPVSRYSGIEDYIKHGFNKSFEYYEI